MNESEIMEQVSGFEVWTTKGQLIATYGKDQLDEARSHISGTTHVLQYVIKGKEKTARVASSMDSSGDFEWPSFYSSDTADLIDAARKNGKLEIVTIKGE